MNYLAYTFSVQPVQPGSEILQALIAEQGFESFDQTETGFVAYIPEALANSLELNDLQFEDFTFNYSFTRIEQQNWNEAWEKNFEPVSVDNLLLIRAPFHPQQTGFSHEIVIMPKMSFGTGHHQTTRLMCRELFELKLNNKRVLDMGCGTAILAILAKQLGAAEVIGIDIDQWCVENSMENCAVNGFTDIDIRLGGVELLENLKPVDCIIANINKNILKAQMAAYAMLINSAGTLLLSGFFVTDAEELKQVAAENGFTFQSMRNENEWCMLRLVK